MTFPFHAIRHLLIDLDGVLYRGTMSLPAASEFIIWLRRQAIGFRLVTNNATLTPAQYQTKLASMGMRINSDEIMTSSLATALYLERQGQTEESAYVIGETGLRVALERLRIRITGDKPRWVIVGLDRQLTYEKLSIAALAIQAGARFLGTNPDTSFPSEVGLVPGAGAILAALQATTGVSPIVVGKPHPLMLQLAMEDMAGSMDNTAMLGDRLDTDIQAAETVGIASIMVLTGVSTRDELMGSAIQPTLVVNDLTSLMRAWSEQSER